MDMEKLDFHKELVNRGKEIAENAVEFERFEHEVDEEEVQRLVVDLDMHRELPIGDEIAPGPFAEKDGETLAPAAYYRGWYGNAWCPKLSKFGGRGGKHQGADLAILSGSEMTNFINRCRIQWNPSGSSGKWGSHIFENFRWNDGVDYTFVYAHLASLIGTAPRTIVGRWEPICKTDCTGNAGGSGMYCGTDNACGRRSDHVHIELHKKGTGRIDPISWLGWEVGNANDNTCKSCV